MINYRNKDIFHNRETIRTFVAVRIFAGENLLSLYSIFKKKLEKERINWTDPQHIHITLKFLGNTGVDLLDNVKSLLESISCRTAPFSVTLGGTGLFLFNKEPRVLYLGIRDNGSISGLAKEIDDQMNNLGFAKENRSFHPHLTLARIKYPVVGNALYILTEEFRNTEIQKSEITGMVLYRSILKPSGPLYEPLETFLFRNEPDSFPQ